MVPSSTSLLGSRNEAPVAPPAAGGKVMAPGAGVAERQAGIVRVVDLVPGVA
jgi:hypothetical protein